MYTYISLVFCFISMIFMKIGLVSDTHGNNENILQAVELFNQEGVGYVLHAGDFADEAAASLFRRLTDAGFIAVSGNCDFSGGIKTAVRCFGGAYHESCFRGSISDKKILMAHMPSTLRRYIDRDDFDLAVFGHTHRPECREEGGTLFVNPGSLSSAEPCVMIVDLDEMSCRKVFLSA